MRQVMCTSPNRWCTVVPMCGIPEMSYTVDPVKGTVYGYTIQWQKTPTCHSNNGSCDKFCMMFTETETNDGCKICGHLKQYHEVGYLFHFTVVTTEFRAFK